MDILKILKYLNKKQWMYVGLAIVFIVLLVYLDLKLPDYMSAITTLVETEGSTMPQILEQGAYMLLCALGSMIASIIVGWFAAQVELAFLELCGKRFITKPWIFPWQKSIVSHLPV